MIIWQKIPQWLSKRKKTVFQIFAIFALLAALATHYVVTTADVDVRNAWLSPLVFLDMFFIISFSVILILRVLEIWGQKKQISKEVYRKHILLFTSILTFPVLLIFIFNTTFMHQGIQAWFGEPVRTSLEVSKNVATAYIDEKFQFLTVTATTLVDRMRRSFIYPMLAQQDLRVRKTMQSNFRSCLQAAVEEETSAFSLTAMMVITDNMVQIARAGMPDLELYPVPPTVVTEAIYKAAPQQLRIQDRLYVVTPIEPIDNKTWLLLVICKALEPQIVKDIDHALAAVKNFTGLEMQKEKSKITLTLLMGLLTLLTVLIAIWFGFMLIEWLMKPISDLILTAIKVKQGNWGVRAQLPPGRNELSALTKTFNMMLDHIYKQHESITNEKDISDTIIAHISQGVVLINHEGMVEKMNTMARSILGINDNTGMALQNISLELYTAFQQYGQSGTQGLEIYISNQQGFRRLHVYIGVMKHFPVQYLMVLDDVTDLLAAQKQASWRDISKRIAHEIKNPLTPIQLSAERLKRKITKEFPKEQQEMFLDYLDVVTRQVQTIANLVRELTSFSQTSSLQMKDINLVDLCRQIVTFYQSSHGAFRFDFTTTDTPLMIQGEETQLQQVLNNLITNAILILNDENQDVKLITVALMADAQTIWLEIRDNGPGFDKDIMHKLAEPYVTKRKGGTGIGLAVVAKILHDHGASLRFSNAEEGGAVVRIGFKRGEFHVAHQI